VKNSILDLNQTHTVIDMDIEEWSMVEWSTVEWSMVEWSIDEWSMVEWSTVEWFIPMWTEWSMAMPRWAEWSMAEWSMAEWFMAERSIPIWAVWSICKLKLNWWYCTHIRTIKGAPTMDGICPSVSHPSVTPLLFYPVSHFQTFQPWISHEKGAISVDNHAKYCTSEANTSDLLTDGRTPAIVGGDTKRRRRGSAKVPHCYK